MRAAKKTKRPLSLIIQSSEFSRIHYGLIMAAAATATDRPITLFFTMGAVRALTPLWGKEEDISVAKKGLATFGELMAAIIEIGADFRVCETSLTSEGLTLNDLRADIELRIAGVVTILAEADKEGSHLVFI